MYRAVSIIPAYAVSIRSLVGTAPD